MESAGNIANKQYVDEREIKGMVRLLLREDGIVEEEWDETNLEIGPEQIMQTKELLGDLVGRKRVRIFVTTSDFTGLTPEGRKTAASLEANEYTIASAVLVNTLAKKLLFNAYLSINKPVVPTKGFTSKEEGIRWLMSMKDPSNVA